VQFLAGAVDAVEARGLDKSTRGDELAHLLDVRANGFLLIAVDCRQNVEGRGMAYD